MKNLIKSLLVLFVVALMGCQGGEDRTNIELIQNMMSGPDIQAQEGSPEGKILMRVPPKGTVARGHKPYPFDKNDVEAADKLKNPLSSLTAEELAKLEKVGEKKFAVYCGICHGLKGDGKGNIAPKMIVPPPSLIEGRFLSYSDGRIYNVITNGWGLMGGYGTQIPDSLERWAIVNYLRKLQKAER